MKEVFFLLFSEASCPGSVRTLCPDSLMTWYGFPSIQPTSSQGCTQHGAMCRNCVFLCINVGLPVNFWSPGFNALCFSLAKKEMVCMLEKFPGEVTMQGNGVPEAAWISQEESPLGGGWRTVLPGQGAPAHGAPQGKGSLLQLLPVK